jgi:L-ascorbate metabolism protein UlaG (beta-lactamase superfamily)
MIILIGIVAIVLAIIGFIAFAPQFGKPPHGTHLEEIKSSPQYVQTKFENNPVVVVSSMDFTQSLAVMWDMLRGKAGRNPSSKLPSVPLEIEDGDNTHLTWFGHSTFFYEVGGKKILFDPMLGKYASPMPGLVKRYDYDLPSSAEELPALDVVVISHDHYDHLDYGTVKKLIEKTEHFVMPLGVGSHLKHWGVPEEKITELDWWEETNIDGVTLRAVPSQHFSGRSLSDGQKTLWAAWIIQNEKANIFFGGDSGYFPGFKKIGEKYGPFNLTLLDAGQYDELWSVVHMTPEEAVNAHKELRGNTFMPIHWSAFTLARHNWIDPVQRARAEAEKAEVKMITPIIGERFNVLIDTPNKKWW